MKEKSFGALLELLLEATDTKGSTLARALRYDTSYLSKWLSGARLPARRNRAELIDSLCDFFVTQGSPGQLEGLAGALELEVQPWERSDMRRLLREALSARLRQALEPDSASPALPGELANSLLLTDRDQANQLVEDAIRLYCQSTSEKDVYFITTHPISRYLLKSSVEEVSKKTTYLYGNKLLHLAQLLACSDINSGSEYCKVILLYTRHNSHVHYKFYVGQSPENVRMMVIKNCLCSMEYYDNLLGRPYRCITKSPAFINEVFAQYQRYLEGQTLVFERHSLARLSKQRYFSSFVMQQRFCCLMANMPVFLPRERMEQQPAYQNLSEDVHILLEMLSNPALHGSVRVMLYRSALMDYILQGKAGLFGQPVTMGRPERRLQLEQLITSLQNGSGLELCLLEDQHPLLARSDLDCSLYLNDTAMFAIQEGDTDAENSCCLFLDSGTIGSFRQFLEEIWREPVGSEANTAQVIRFLQRGLAVLAQLDA